MNKLREEPHKNEEKSVLWITYNWPPDAFVGTVRPVKIVSHLRKHGWNPIVLTVSDKYYEQTDHSLIQAVSNTPVVRTRCIPSLRNLYLRLKAVTLKLRRETQRGEHSTVQSDKNATKVNTASAWERVKVLVLSLMYTPDEYLGWLPFAVSRAVQMIRTKQIECMISTGPPFTTHLVALAVKNMCGVPWVVDFRDPWGGGETRDTKVTSSLSDRLNRTLERAVVQHADRVVCVTTAMTDWYRCRYPLLPCDRWVTITNGFAREEFEDVRLFSLADRFTISYLGSIEYARTPELLLQAVGGLIQKGLIDRQRIAIRLIGRCHTAQGRRTEDLIRANNLVGVVELVHPIPRPEALREMKRSHVLLLLANQQRLQVPGKAYEYIGSGRHILAITEKEGATAELIRRVGGAVVEPDDVSGMKAVVKAWYDEFRLNGDLPAQDNGRWDEITKEYEWSELGARYATLIEGLCWSGQGE